MVSSFGKVLTSLAVVCIGTAGISGPFETVRTPAFVDVTKAPYYADNTGRTDCTKVLVKVLDDILVREVEAYEATIEKLKRLSEDGKTDVHLGLEGAHVEQGRMMIVYPEKVPPTRIVYFPKGTYLVSDTITYSLKNLKARHYIVPYFDNCRNINFLGESRDETVIRLVDNAPGFGSGAMKPLVSFVNNEKKLPRDREVSNIAFMNFMRNLTLDCGKGNPDAVGIKYIASNIGRLENLSIRTDRGRCGVYTMCGTEAVFEDLAISGFDYGMDIYSSCMIVIDGLDVTGVRKAGLLLGKASINAGGVTSGDRPAVAFTQEGGRFYSRDSDLKLPAECFDNHVYVEEEGATLRDMPFPPRYETDSDFALVDDFGARGDGVTDSAPAIQVAMNSGKSVVVFGSGEYLLNGKVKVPKGVRKIDFGFCSLAAGIRLVGGEYDAAFEIAEEASEPLSVECLDAWENLHGHFRLFKHAAKRDVVFRDLHLMTASLYFNTVPGSRVWFDNVFLTTGTYTQPGVIHIPGKEFVPIYSRIIPLEFHGQKVYGRRVNLERADVHVLNDASEILFDAYRTEGPGTALKSINGGQTRINLFNAGIGLKTAPRALFDLRDSVLELKGALSFGFDRNTEYNVLVNSVKEGKVERLLWDDVKIQKGPHGRLIDSFSTLRRPATSGRTAADELAKLLLQIRPRAVFTHWPIDNHADHAQCSALLVNALRLSGLKPERYFFEEWMNQTRNMVPTYYVDVTKTFPDKLKALSFYVCQNENDSLLKMTTKRAKWRGRQRVPAVAYAEPFTTWDGRPVKDGVFASLAEAAVAPGAEKIDISTEEDVP